MNTAIDRHAAVARLECLYTTDTKRSNHHRHYHSGCSSQETGYEGSGNLNEFWIVNAVVILNVTWTVEFWSETWNEA